MGLGSLGYLVPLVPAFVAARIAQGSAWAVLNTAAPAIAVGMAPDTQRARAIGMLNMGRNAAIPIAPAVGLYLAANYSYGLTFVVISIVGLLSALVALRLHRLSVVARGAGSGRLGLTSLVVPSALLPAAIQSFVFAGAPLLYTFVPLYGHAVAVEDVGLVYVAAGITMILVQPLARLSDRFGRLPSITVGVGLAAAGLFSFTAAASLAGLAASAALWAAGSALVEPSTTALVIDRSALENRGAALATYTAAFQVGNAVGATIWGALIVSQGFGAAFIAGAGTTAAALVFVGLAALRRTRES
jgi:predicted MFS family arabinose efflux permease